jgi:hypothetical protein
MTLLLGIMEELMTPLPLVTWLPKRGNANAFS